MKRKTLEENPYEKFLDDAKSKLKETGQSLDYLDTIPDTAKSDPDTVPFPYGRENTPDLGNS